MTEKADLLPCPFCGGMDIREDVNLRNGFAEVFCDDCGATVTDEHKSVDARYCWNRRAAPASAEPVKLGSMPLHGAASFNELAAAVTEAVVGDRNHEFEFEHENLFIGHQIVPTINFNSLNRIVTAFVNGSKVPT